MINNKDIPVLFNDNEECCGCTACFAICPVKAIKMIPDTEGFEYPIIQEKICIGCGRCILVCPCKMNVGASDKVS